MKIEKNISLKNYCTFKTGGTADFFVVVKNIEELKQATNFAGKNSLPVFVLGGGSNLLISDEGVRGLVIKIEMKGIKITDEVVPPTERSGVGGTTSGSNFAGNSNILEVIACSGEVWDDLVKKTVEENLFGLENLSGVPGTVGASVVQNIECYGSEVATSVEWVEVFDTKINDIKKLSKEDCNFSYRNSIFKIEKDRYIVTKVCFNLSKKGKLNFEYKDIKNKIKEECLVEENISASQLRNIILDIRKNKLPNLRDVGTAGSFFKCPVVSNKDLERLVKIFPEMPHYKKDIGCNTSLQGENKIPIAYILENLGWKGYKERGVGVYDKHSLVLVNNDNGNTTAVKNLAEKIQKQVKDKTGLNIDWEVVEW